MKLTVLKSLNNKLQKNLCHKNWTGKFSDNSGQILTFAKFFKVKNTIKFVRDLI